MSDGKQTPRKRKSAARAGCASLEARAAEQQQQLLPWIKIYHNAATRPRGWPQLGDLKGGYPDV